MFLKENRVRYLKSWEYNAARILTALDTLVVERGGHTNGINTVMIVNRSLSDAKNEYNEKIARIKSLPQNDVCIKTLDFYQHNLNELDMIPNDPIPVCHRLCIRFVLDGFYYQYTFDENPFFDTYLIKTPIKNETYSIDLFGTTVSADWMDDCYLKWGCPDSDIEYAANEILAMLISAKPCEILHEIERKCVPNTYNDGYHYEKVPRKERFDKIDF